VEKSCSIILFTPLRPSNAQDAVTLTNIQSENSIKYGQGSKPMKIGESFIFKAQDRNRTIEGVATLYDVDIKPSTHQVFITISYEDHGQIQYLSLDLNRFWQIVVQKQSTL
jgi:hypothetical protein